MELIAAIFIHDITPILLIAAIGFLLLRYARLDIRSLSSLTLNVLIPCLIFDALVTSQVSAAEFARNAAFAACTVLASGLAAWLCAQLLHLERALASAFILVVMFANVGNYGLPLNLFAFGQPALPYATIFVVVNLTLAYTLGIFIASRGQASVQRSLLSVLKAPAVYAVLAAGLVLWLDIQVWEPLNRSISLLSDAAVPAQILVLGMQLGVARIERPLPLSAAAALRLLLSPLLALGFALLFSLRGVAFQAGLLQAATPTAVIAAILAVEYQAEPDFATSVVFLSTLISPFTLTLLIAALQSL
ncbi:MAG: AEC family transporter [Chloroflexota bacterium]